MRNILKRHFVASEFIMGLELFGEHKLKIGYYKNNI
jgi:hypothetical protein